jgi:glutathione S-transferase
MMAFQLADLDEMLDALEADLPRMIRENPQVADFCMAFIAEADAIEARADGAELAHVRARIDGMLARHGSIGPPGHGDRV